MSNRNDQVVEHLAKCATDVEYFAAAHLKIMNERKDLVYFGKFYPGPRLVQDAIDEQVSQGRPVRVTVLKARRHRITATTQANIFHRLLFGGRNRNAIVVSHEKERSNEIIGIHHNFHASLPGMMRPELRASAKGELWFDFKSAKAREANPDKRLNNRIKAMTVTGGARRVSSTQGAAGIGRGGSYDYVHFSEAAFYPNADEIMRSMMQTVANGSHSFVAIESTANGQAGWFYNHWTAANRGDNEYKAIFLPWYIHPEYKGTYLAKTEGRVELLPSEKEDKLFVELQAEAALGQSGSVAKLQGRLGLSDDELRLATEHPVSLDQLLWRRYAIQNKCSGSLEQFHVEYPSTWQEAFASSGQPRFNNTRIAAWMDYKRGNEKIVTGDLVAEGEWHPIVHGSMKPSLMLVEGYGSINVVAEPVDGSSYVIGSDSGRGIGKDRSTATVLRRDTKEMVAYIRDDRIPPDKLSLLLIKLGWWYNMAWLAPEVNDPGGVTVHDIVRSRYPRIYFRQQLDHISERWTERPGWETNQKTRPDLITTFAAYIDDPELPMPPLAICEEALTFVSFLQGTRWRDDHLEGCHDDLLFSAMIALFVGEHLGGIADNADDGRAGDADPFVVTDLRPRVPKDLPTRIGDGILRDRVDLFF